MRKNFLIVEGKRDAIFIEEIICSLFPQKISVKSYEKVRLLYEDMNVRKQADISILYGLGFPGCVELAVHLSRDLWNVEDLYSIGVIADSDRGPVYPQMSKYLQNYLNTKCKRHNVHPQIIQINAQHFIKITFDQNHEICLWTLEIPGSLEMQISKVLKSKYPALEKYGSTDEVIEAASRKFGKTFNNIIKEVIEALERHEWFKKFCRTLKERIE